MNLYVSYFFCTHFLYDSHIVLSFSKFYSFYVTKGYPWGPYLIQLDLTAALIVLFICPTHPQKNKVKVKFLK